MSEVLLNSEGFENYPNHPDNLSLISILRFRRSKEDIQNSYHIFYKHLMKVDMTAASLKKNGTLVNVILSLIFKNQRMAKWWEDKGEVGHCQNDHLSGQYIWTSYGWILVGFILSLVWRPEIHFLCQEYHSFTAFNDPPCCLSLFWSKFTNCIYLSYFYKAKLENFGRNRLRYIRWLVISGAKPCGASLTLLSAYGLLIQFVVDSPYHTK